MSSIRYYSTLSLSVHMLDALMQCSDCGCEDPLKREKKSIVLYCYIHLNDLNINHFKNLLKKKPFITNKSKQFTAHAHCLFSKKSEKENHRI